MTETENKKDFLWRHIPLWLLLWGLCVAVLFVGRLFLYIAYTDAAVRQSHAADVPALLIKGLLFDIKAASLISALPVLSAFVSVSMRRLRRLYARTAAWLCSLLLTATLAAVAANGAYFKVYERQFDIFVFGLLEEDTVAVLGTLWADYPVVWSVLVLAAVAYAAYRVFRRLGRRHFVGRSSKTVAAVCVVLTVLLVLGGRGSLGKFPLRQDDAQISASDQINRLVANAWVALDWARKEHKNSRVFRSVSDEEGTQLMDRLGVPGSGGSLQRLYVHSPAHAVPLRQPNVVLAVMESMGSHLLEFDAPQRDLLGSLKMHWQQDWVYRRFVSEGDGTSDSLHRLFVRSPLLNLSQSSAKRKQFPANLFRPYREAGYRTVYITSGNGAWRDFNGFLKHLGVDEFVDENAIKTRYPEAESGTWGVPDEFMFRYAVDELAEAEREKRPVFIMMLSVTHHPPYRLPVHIRAVDMQLNETERQRLSHLGTAEQINEILNTYRYANDQLGHFVTAVKQQAAPTLIAATGDHNIRSIGYADPQEAALGHAVPLYLYVPEAYRTEAVYRPLYPSSHKDIMPTLYELSLPGRSYYSNGCNITAPRLLSNWCGYGYNREVVVFEDGFYRLADRAFHPWADEQGLRGLAITAVPKQPEKVAQAEAFAAFMDWQIQKTVALP